MRTQEISFKNKKTGKCETIKLDDLEQVGWGFYFYCDTELEAYKAAYQYRNNPYGVGIEYCPSIQRWSVTVLNESGGKLFGANK